MHRRQEDSSSLSPGTPHLPQTRAQPPSLPPANHTKGGVYRGGGTGGGRGRDRLRLLNTHLIPGSVLYYLI